MPPRCTLIIFILLLEFLKTGKSTAKIQMHTTATKPGARVQLTCIFFGQGKVVQVNWRKTAGLNQTRIAVFHPEFGPYIHPDYRKAVKLENQTKTNVSLIIENFEEEENVTYCCKYITFPSGNLEECARLMVENNTGISAKLLASYSDLLGILALAILSPIAVVIFFLIRKQRRPPVYENDHYIRHIQEASSIPIRTSQHEQTPFSPVYVMINADYLPFREGEAAIQRQAQNSPPPSHPTSHSSVPDGAYAYVKKTALWIKDTSQT
ncbi:transmembrane protein PVRIG-like [Protopterus annectens]|uniref:transmembrane protein PVRIG-like n=1 Tax=Protopterus annectens TaxID=7888 RepID=UPI001CFB80AF|nr:transmembrane protein PVRIG-like [Protopterus annectens]